jgi:hypothetical protein
MGWDPIGEAGEWDLPTVARMLGLRGDDDPDDPDDLVIRGTRSLTLTKDDDKPGAALSPSQVDARLQASVAARLAAGPPRRIDPEV